MQIPAAFDYARAGSVEEAISLLEQHGEDARLIAGGHSLLPMMKLRLAGPSLLIDINDLTDLQRISVDGDVLRIGAMVRHAELLDSAVVGEHFQILHDAERVIADPIVRNRGTVGGSLCHADPAEDLSAVLAGLKAELVVRGSGGERAIADTRVAGRPIRDGAGSGRDRDRDQDPDPTWCRQRVHQGAPLHRRLRGCRCGCDRVARRHHDHRCRHRSCCGRRTAQRRRSRPKTRSVAARLMTRRSSSPRRTASEECSPHTDQRGPADYKRALTGELTKRALRKAIARCRGEEQ